MQMTRLVTQDNRYVVIVETPDEHSYSEYLIYNAADEWEVQENMHLPPETFKRQTKELPEITLSVRWDGCANMNAMASGVHIHFCNSEHIHSLHRVIELCYEDARSKYNFED